MTARTIKVQSETGPIDAACLATFAKEIGGRRFRFAVTRIAFRPPALTERRSGLKLCDLTGIAQFRLAADSAESCRMIGQNALAAIVEKHGEVLVKAKIMDAPPLRAEVTP